MVVQDRQAVVPVVASVHDVSAPVARFSKSRNRGLTAFISGTVASRSIASENRFSSRTGPRSPAAFAQHGSIGASRPSSRQGTTASASVFRGAEEEEVVIEVLGGGGGVDRHRTERERLAPYDLALLGGSNEGRARGGDQARWDYSPARRSAGSRSRVMSRSTYRAQMPLKALRDFVSCRFHRRCSSASANEPTLEVELRFGPRGHRDARTRLLDKDDARAENRPVHEPLQITELSRACPRACLALMSPLPAVSMLIGLIERHIDRPRRRR